MRSLKEIKEMNFLNLSEVEKDNLIYDRLSDIEKLSKKDIIEILLINGFLIDHIKKEVKIDADMAMAAVFKYGSVLYYLPIQYIINNKVIRRARKAENPVNITIGYIVLWILANILSGIRYIFRAIGSLLERLLSKENMTFEEKEQKILKRLNTI